MTKKKIYVFILMRENIIHVEKETKCCDGSK